MKTILCYGDSNTWGYDPRTGNRYDYKTRWPMVLKSILNRDAPVNEPEWWVVEEGLNGRTSCREDPVEGDRNGLRQLIPILESHKPIDIAAIMLGTNDLKPRFNPTAYDIACGAQAIARAVQKSETGPNGTAPTVILICPPETIEAPVFAQMFAGSVKISAQLPPFFEAMARECGAYFLNAGAYIQSSPADGIHLDPDDHRKLAEAVAGKVREISK